MNDKQSIKWICEAALAILDNPEAPEEATDWETVLCTCIAIFKVSDGGNRGFTEDDVEAFLRGEFVEPDSGRLN